MNMSESLTTCKDRVEYVLSYCPGTRESDKKLWLVYMHNFHGLGFVEGYNSLVRIIMDEETPSMETLRRIRQKFQQKGLFLGSNRAKQLEEAEKVKNKLRDL